MEVIQINDGSKGYFQALENDREAGRMTYSWAGQEKIIIDHTEVDPDFSGRGIGKKLVMKAVEQARKDNFKIVPLCPFAKSVFEKVDDIRDVLFK